MQRATVGNIELAYKDKGSGPVLLLVHGFPLDHSMWSEQIEAQEGAMAGGRKRKCTRRSVISRFTAKTTDGAPSVDQARLASLEGLIKASLEKVGPGQTGEDTRRLDGRTVVAGRAQQRQRRGLGRNT